MPKVESGPTCAMCPTLEDEAVLPCREMMNSAAWPALFILAQALAWRLTMACTVESLPVIRLNIGVTMGFLLLKPSSLYWILALSLPLHVLGEWPQGPVTALVMALGDNMAAVVGAYLAQRYERGLFHLSRPSSIYALFSASVSAGVCACLPILFFEPLYLFGILSLLKAASVVCGNLLVVPCLFGWGVAPDAGSAKDKRLVWEGVAMFAALGAVCWVVFGIQSGLPPWRMAINAFIPLLLLFWPALRFYPRHTALALLLVGSSVALSAAGGIGPLALLTAMTGPRMLFHQAVLLCLSLLFLTMAALGAARRQAVSVLREHLDRFHIITDTSCSWESWIAPDGSLLWTNSTVERITGYTPKEYTRLPDRLRVIAADEESYVRLRDVLQSAIRDRCAIDDTVLPIRRKDGAQRWISICCKPVLAHDGRYLGVRTSVLDVTDRLRAKE